MYNGTVGMSQMQAALILLSKCWGASLSMVIFVAMCVWQIETKRLVTGSNGTRSQVKQVVHW